MNSKPILLDIPMPILTPRLILHPPGPGDGAELNAAVLETFDVLKDWMPWADHKPTLDESEENVRHAYAKWILREDLRISLYDRETGAFAGGSGLHRVNWDLPSFEIGYWVRSRFAGKGYITESTHALTRFAFEQLGAKRVELRCDSKNLKSLAIFKRLGFEYEGCLRKNGPGRDTLIYSRLDTRGLPELEVSWG